MENKSGSADYKRYIEIKEELKVLGEKIGQLQQDSDEHRLVIAALEPLPSDRKCFRRIGGILVESTVSQTKPVLETNLYGVSYNTC